MAIIAAYAPGEHTTAQEISRFWTLLKNYLTKLPNRTHTFMGIDANGHIGRDTPEPYVGNCGSTKWTHNGQEQANIDPKGYAHAADTKHHKESCLDRTRV